VILLRVLVFIGGFSLAAWTIFSAVRTFVLPRAANDSISRFVFVNMRKLFNLLLVPFKRYEQRDGILAFYAPISLISLLPVWMFLVWIGFSSMFWAIEGGSPFNAFRISGSDLFTLGFASSENTFVTMLGFMEAMVGLMLVALLIAYLPSMYNAFSRREAAVSMLEVRAGSPPSAVEMLARYSRLHGLDKLGQQWEAWETWFTEIEESHTSLAALVFFRSPRPERSWVSAAGAVMDAAALTRSSVDIPADPRADLCIRAGFIALRHIADYFGYEYHPDPHYPEQPISVSRERFDAALDRLAEDGVRIRPDREQAWCDFAGWRVNYDQVLLALARLTMSPEAPWMAPREDTSTPSRFKRFRPRKLHKPHKLRRS
jgi:hypothetical protein